MTAQPAKPAPTSRWLPVVLGVASLILYLVSLHRDLAGGDSGELAAVACSGGVVHPPGYPLYTLISRLFLLIPLGVPAARVNAVSAVSEAFAVWAIAAILLRVTKRRSAAILGAGLFAIVPGVWEYARVAEVFALNNALVAISLLCALIDVEQKSKRSAALFGLFSGLALANHQTALFFLVPVGVYRVWKHPQWKYIIGFGALGLSFYLSLMWSGRTNTPFTWGNTTTLAGLWHHMLRRDYGTLQLANGAAATNVNLGTFLIAYLKSEIVQTFGIGLILFVAGLALAWKTRVHFAFVAFTFGIWALYLVVFGSMSNLPLDLPLTLGVVGRFWQLPHLLFCLIAGVAVAWLPKEKITLGLSLAIVLILGIINSREIEFGGNHLLRTWAMELLNRRPNSITMVQGDVVGNPMRYMQACEHVRPDVILIDEPQLTFSWHVDRLKQVYPELKLPGTKWHPREAGSFNLGQFLTANSAHGPLEVCGRFKAGDDSAKSLMELWPDGICEHVIMKTETWDPNSWLLSLQREPPTELRAEKAVPGTWEREVANEYWQQRASLAYKALNAGIPQNDARFYRKAVELYRDIEANIPEKTAGLYKNYGIAAGRLAQTEPKYEALTFEMLARFVKLAAKSDPDYAKLKEAVDNYYAGKPKQ